MAKVVPIVKGDRGLQRQITADLTAERAAHRRHNFIWHGLPALGVVTLTAASLSIGLIANGNTNSNPAFTRPDCGIAIAGTEQGAQSVVDQATNYAEIDSAGNYWEAVRDVHRLGPIHENQRFVLWFSGNGSYIDNSAARVTSLAVENCAQLTPPSILQS
jgi:hypothetical protein